MSEILRQLEILRNTTVSDEELTAAKDMAIKELREMQDYPGAVASFRFANEIYGIDANISQKVVAITNVTPSDITEIAKNTVLNTVFFLKGTALEDNEHES